MLSLCFRILVADSDLGPWVQRDLAQITVWPLFLTFLRKVHPFVGTARSRCTDPELQAQRRAFLQHKNGITLGLQPRAATKVNETK